MFFSPAGRMDMEEYKVLVDGDGVIGVFTSADSARSALAELELDSEAHPAILVSVFDPAGLKSGADSGTEPDSDSAKGKEESEQAEDIEPGFVHLVTSLETGHVLAVSRSASAAQSALDAFGSIGLTLPGDRPRIVPIDKVAPWAAERIAAEKTTSADFFPFRTDPGSRPPPPEDGVAPGAIGECSIV